MVAFFKWRKITFPRTVTYCPVPGASSSVQKATLISTVFTSHFDVGFNKHGASCSSSKWMEFDVTAELIYIWNCIAPL